MSIGTLYAKKKVGSLFCKITDLLDASNNDTKVVYDIISKEEPDKIDKLEEIIECVNGGNIDELMDLILDKDVDTKKLVKEYNDIKNIIGYKMENYQITKNEIQEEQNKLVLEKLELKMNTERYNTIKNEAEEQLQELHKEKLLIKESNDSMDKKIKLCEDTILNIEMKNQELNTKISEFDISVMAHEDEKKEFYTNSHTTNVKLNNKKQKLKDKEQELLNLENELNSKEAKLKKKEEELAMATQKKNKVSSESRLLNSSETVIFVDRDSVCCNRECCIIC